MGIAGSWEWVVELTPNIKVCLLALTMKMVNSIVTGILWLAIGFLGLYVIMTLVQPPI